MELNADFSQRIVLHGADLEWLASPMAGVHRRMLDRIGGEVARATSIVRYQPGSQFSPHVHTGGEEFIVLDGIFSDEHGDFPAGSYIRNPPQSQHTPGSAPGCVIFVKLWQFDLADRTHVRTNVNKIGGVMDSTRPGVLVTPLYRDHRETVRYEEWAPHSEVSLETKGGAEILLLDGSASESNDTLQAQSWLRLPSNTAFLARAGEQGAKVWIKTGHLDFAGPTRPSAR